MRDIFLIDIPLFSEKSLSALEEIDVNNFDTYNAEIHSPEGQIFRNYKAVNIIGLVGCADLTRSDYLPETESPLMGFSRLIIDERKIEGFDLFRLAENTLFILVSERVKKKLEELELVGVKFDPIESNR